MTYNTFMPKQRRHRRKVVPIKESAEDYARTFLRCIKETQEVRLLRLPREEEKLQLQEINERMKTALVRLSKIPKPERDKGKKVIENEIERRELEGDWTGVIVIRNRLGAAARLARTIGESKTSSSQERK